MNRRRLAAAVIGVVVTSSVGGFIVGSRITSPAEVAARTAPPTAAPILVPVERRVLASDVVTRGTGRYGSPQKLAVAASALKPAAGLIAELPVISTELKEGDRVANASGRPLFLLVGPRPMSRDLGPGLTGDDVMELEQALQRLGFDVGPVDGTYDEATEAGVTAWYSANGFAAFTATPDQLAAIRARETELAAASIDRITADGAVATAQAALEAARATAESAARHQESTMRSVERTRLEGQASVAAADNEVSFRKAALDIMRAGGPPRGTAAEIAVAEADLAASTANQLAVRAAGARAVADAQTALNQAPARRDAASGAAAAADAAAQADVAAKQAALEALLADPASFAPAIAAARADLAAAAARANDVHLSGVQAIADAQAALSAAPAALDAARAQAAAADSLAASDVVAKTAHLNNLKGAVVPTPADIAAAERELAVAVATAAAARLTADRALADATSAAADTAADARVKASDVTVNEQAVTNATLAAVSRATITDLAAQEADRVKRRAGVQVPADEVVFVANGPVRLAELLVGKGDQLLGGIMKISDAVVHIEGTLAVSEAGLVTPGMAVKIEEPDLGISTDGSVTVIAAAPGTNGVDGFHVFVEIAVPAPPPNLVGASVRLTIPVESTNGEVLAVPLSALTLGPDGSSRVQRDRGGTAEFVRVTAGLSADGYVEITAISGNLEAGDLVVVSAGQPAGAGGDAGPNSSVPASTEVPTDNSTPPTSGGAASG